MPGKINHYLPVILLLALATTSGRTEEAEHVTNFLIENVSLVTNQPADDAETHIVNLLIRDRKLEIVTKDEVPIDELTLRVDASDTYLLGNLTIGAEPNFLILDSDPRTNFDVLLDTNRFMVFAVRSGEVYRNKLDTTEAEPEEVAAITTEAGTVVPGKKEPGWLAYTPPPMMLPTGYLDATQWNRWETNAVSGIFVGALALDRMQWTSQDAISRAQVGQAKDFDGGAIRALRFGAVGTLNFDKPWVYTLLGATKAFDQGFDESTDDSFQWLDVRLDIPFYSGTTLSIGKQKEPISMERLTPLPYISMEERAGAIDAMLPSRNTGIVLSGAAVGGRMSWAGGVFNRSFENGGSPGNAATQFTGRVTALPFVSEDRSNLIHIGLGGRYSNAKNGIRYYTRPEFFEAPIYVDTDTTDNGLVDLIDADQSVTWDLEASWRKGPFWLSSEFVRTEVDSASAGNPTFSGYYIAGVWSLTGEMRKYDNRAGLFLRPPVAKSAYQGGLGAWELTARYSNTNLTDGNIAGGDMDIASVGLRWWLTTFFMLDLNYRYITLNNSQGQGDSSGVDARIFISLE